MAEMVLRTPEPRLQRQLSENDEQTQTKPLGGKVIPSVQRKDISGISQVSPKFEANINAIRGSGQPLPESARAFFESRFGHNFSQVRIHTDTRAAESAQAMNARAYTVGRDVVFGSGQFDPETLEGKKLLMHEVVHVVQQKGQMRGMQRQVKESKKEPEKEPKLLQDFASKFADAADLIRKSDAAMKLVREAAAANVKFGGYAEEGPGKTLGRAYTSGERVYVPKTQTDKVLAMRDFLFELNNAIRAPKFAELTKEAVKGAAGKLTAKQFAYKMTEQEVEGMLRLGEVWFEMKKTIGKDAEWNKYDNYFFLSEYKQFKEGKKSKDDVVKNVLKRVYETGTLKGKTVEQYYMDEYNRLSGGK